MKRIAILMVMLLISMTCIMAQAVSDYTFSTVTNGSLEDMSTDTTTLLTGYSDSGATAVTDIGFSFTFAGTAYTQFSANANGLVRLGGTVISGYSTSPVASAAILGTFSGDNCIASTGKIHYKLIGAVAPRKLVIEFKELRLPYAGTPGAGTPSTVQVWLTETSNIVNYVYGAMYNNSTSSLGRGVFISSNTTTGNIGSVATIVTTPSWVTTGTSVVTSSFAASSYMTNLNSTADGSRRVFTFLPPDPFAVPNPAIVGYPLNGSWAFTDATLSWASGGGVPTSYDVYFGTSTTPPLVSDDQTGLTYTPTLAANTTYYWQIVPRNDNGEAVNCPVWSFKTPTATQLAESFESTTFPPAGWANPGTWSRSTTTPFHGTGTAYKSASTTPAILSTPIMVINASSVLNFYYRTSSTTGYGLMNIKYSTDRVTWNQIGATISMPTTNEWRNANVALGAIPAGNYYLGFEVLTSTSTSSIYIDHVFGPEPAALAPDSVTLTAPADLATNQAIRPTFTWTAPTTGGAPTGYRVYCDTNTNPTTQIADVSTLSYTATNALAYSTTYYWKVVAYNGTGSSADSAIRSFTTIPDPTIYTMPWLEDFGTTGTTFPPANWFRGTGVLADPSTVTSSTTYWIQDNWLNDTTVTPVNYSARMNIYSTSRYGWLITPPIQMPGAGYQLEFDMGLTDYGNGNVPEVPSPDDRFIILIGDGVTWTPANVLREYNNTGSPYVYDTISNLGDHLIFPLDSYTGIKYIAFYGESTVSNADNDFFVDNVLIRQTPVGAPEHVTLTSPVDGATGLWPENLTLSWTASMTGGTPAYYEVYVGENPIDPGTSYYGEYMYETTNTSLNLSAQDDINLGYSTTWYWAVLPYNSGGQSPDPDTPDFNVWDFTTIADPTITSLPHTENFDGVTAPTLPYGWTSYINSTVTTGYVNTYSSTTYAVSAPNSARLYNSTDASANLMLITPQINVPINTFKAKFYARGSTAGQVLLVGTVNTADNTFTQLGSIATTAAQVEYEVSFADYLGADTHIAFKHGLGATSRTIYVDNVRLLQLLPVDLAATSIAGPAILNAGTAYDFTVNVFNEGTATQNSYTVNLMSMGTRTLLATMNVSTPLDPGATAQYTLSWTPATGGVFDIFGEVVAVGDGNAVNDETPLKEVYVLDNTMTVIPVGDDATTTSGYYVPISMYYKNGVTEELYFPDEMHLQSGTITAVAYKNTFVTNLMDKPIKIWMAHTTVTDLSAGWLPAIDYTLVFDGVVDFPSGVNYIVIPLDTPFAYTGGTLATRFYRPMDTAYFSTSDKFYYTTNPAHTIRSRYLHSDSVTYDPLAPSAAGTTLGYFPNTNFVVQNAVMQTGAILQGTVYDNNNLPLAGATVTLTERYATTTDAEGFYSFTFWENHTVNATVSKAAYYTQTINNLALTLGNTVTQNFYLVPMPRETVSGIITSNVFPSGLEGASISLTGSENYSTVSGTGGAFSIPNVLGSSTPLAYTINVSKTGYQPYIAAVNVGEAAVNLGTLNLVEFLWPAYNLVATHSGNNASLVWDPAGEPDYIFFDFEADNGGWVGSGYGDWEYTNTYTLTGYTDNDTSVGTPPTAAHSGDGLWGTKVLGDYSNSSAWSYLRKTVDLAGFTSPVLSIWHYMNGYNTYDYGIIKVNGTTVWGSSAAAVFMPWQQLTVPLTAFEGMSTVEISFEWYATSVVSYAGWYLDDIYIGPASSVPALANRNGDRSLQNYSVYRMLSADEAIPANWILLNNAVTENTYTDTAFGAQAGGKYKWAVKANYSGALQSEALLSNQLGIVAMPEDVTATPVGATVQLGWAADPGADYYVIYASDDPYGTFTLLGYSATNSYTINTPAARKFYKIASADGTMPNPAPPAKALSK